VVDQILSHRRLFIAPIKGTPTLSTVNGIGGSLYGSSDQDKDGTYIATHFLVLIFLPIFPLAQYLVSDAKEAKGKSWYFVGKVPMSTPVWLWNRLVVASVFAAMGVGAFQAYYWSSHHEVHFVNGLSKPVHIKAGEREVDVAPRSRQVLSLPTGTLPLRVTATGKDIETGTLSVEAGTHIHIWNVLGAAPVVKDTVYYTANNVKPPETTPSVHCAETNIVIPSADYVFVEPPATLSMPENQSMTTRQAVLLAPGDLSWCLGAFAKPGKGAAAEALAKGLVALDESLDSLQTAATVMRVASKPEGALPLIRQALTREPDSLDLHRLFQITAKEAGQDQTLVDEYRARREASPDSADAAYLHLRLLPRLGKMDDVIQAAARFPDHAMLNRLAGFVLVRSLSFKEAAAALDRMKELDRDIWLDSAEEHVATMAALGRTDDAQKIAREAFEGLEGDRKLGMAAVVSWLGGPESPGEALLGKSPGETPDDRMLWRLRYWTAQQNAAIPKGPVARLLFTSRYQPVDALTQVAAMKPEDISAVGVEVAVLLEGEALRTKNERAISKIDQTLDLMGVPQARIKAYLTEGAWSEDVDEMPLPLHAALHAARARGAQLSPLERKRLLDLARQCDPVGGFTRRALAGWPSV